jgi:glycosyltransferase involved in cell wall biosynthesis
MKVGSLVFCTAQGLGYLAKSFYDAGVVTSVLVVRHGRRPEHPEWFPDARYVNNLRSLDAVQDMRDFCLRQDVMLFFETPFDWSLLPFCRANGVAAVLMPMHECSPDPLPETPDAPRFPQWRRRGRAEVFVHNSGWGGLKGRNGTGTVLEAWQYVRSGARLVVRTQDERTLGFGAAAGWRKGTGQRVRVVHGTLPREQLYDEGDVFLFPERFNGLSLPLQEAYAAGMLVMATDRHPVNTWLPHGPLIPAEGFVPSSVSPRFRQFREAVVRPSAVAKAVDEWYGKDVGDYSEQGREWAEKHSWAKLGPRYLDFLSKVAADVRGRVVA